MARHRDNRVEGPVDEGARLDAVARRAVDEFRDKAPKNPSVRRAWLALAAAVKR